MAASDGKDPAKEGFEIAMGRCPRNHKLPHRGKHGRCTAMFCEKDHKPKSDSTVTGMSPTRRESPAPSALALAPGDQASSPSEIVNPVVNQDALAPVDSDEVVRMGNAAGRYAARMSFLKVPKFKDVKDGEEWSDKKIAELLPVAVATKEHFLKFGDDKQRDKAADDILAANGRTRRDIGGNAGPAIVIMTNDGKITVPWAQRKDVKVIDGEVSTGEDV